VRDRLVDRRPPTVSATSRPGSSAADDLHARTGPTILRRVP